MSRWLLSGLAALLCAGCASGPPASEVVEEATYNLNQHRQMLRRESTGAAGEIQPYQLAASEAFRMPVALQAEDPVLPPDQLGRSLAPTTVCVNVIVDAQGQVQRSEPLVAHSACRAGADAANAGLLQAVVAATTQWRFQPAATCHYPPGRVPPAADDCSGATREENVPVTLAYAFTFEVVEGRAMVRRQGGLR